MLILIFPQILFVSIFVFQKIKKRSLFYMEIQTSILKKMDGFLIFNFRKILKFKNFLLFLFENVRHKFLKIVVSDKKQIVQKPSNEIHTKIQNLKVFKATVYLNVIFSMFFK